MSACNFFVLPTITRMGVLPTFGNNTLTIHRNYIDCIVDNTRRRRCLLSITLCSTLLEGMHIIRCSFSALVVTLQEPSATPTHAPGPQCKCTGTRLNSTPRACMHCESMCHELCFTSTYSMVWVLSYNLSSADCFMPYSGSNLIITK